MATLSPHSADPNPAQRSETTDRSPAPIFAALGDRTRLELIARLSEEGGGRSIAHLAAGLPLTRQAISKHLQVLESAGLVASMRVGRESRYAVKPDAFDFARSYLEAIYAQWDGARARRRARGER
ncbi:ArsR/SmtB family transcription factor [Amorphus sp. MBR-141]